MTHDAPNSLQARDIASVVHPYTQLKKHLTGRPAGHRPRQAASTAMDDDGKDYHRGHGRPVVRVARLRRGAAGRGGLRADAAAALLPRLRQRSHEPAIELAEKLQAMAPVPMSKVFFANSGSEANDTAGQAGLVLQQRARPAAEEEDHLAASRAITASPWPPPA